MSGSEQEAPQSAEARPAEDPTHANEENGEGHPAFKVFDRRFWQQDEGNVDNEEPRAEVPSYVKQLQDQLAEKDKQLREYIAAYKKEVVEELDQARERMERDSAQQMSRMRGELATPMMDVLDAIERALEVARGTQDIAALMQGFEMVQLLMVQKLKDIGLSRIETVGQRFDPQIHEAVALTQAEDPAQDGTIVREFSPGFALGDQIIRAPRVQVAKG